ncbi:MAG TPA: GNAT family N-acetyltransferase [Candidatus Acidoferrales bacterium]|nr:GNAT family N-acetyltransferase [Candidatus Acidoferrales bacterium]
MIRPIETRDAAAWAAMRSRLWPFEDAVALADEARAFVEGTGEGIVDAVFLAEDDDALPVGFLELSVRAFSDGCDSAPVPHVEGWFVEEPARHRGLGRALVAAAEAWARERGYTELASDTEIDNEASRLAHGRLGFEEVDRLIKFRKRL